jgi:hypothetical protein
MPKRKAPAPATDEEFDFARVWIPLSQAQALLSIASEVEGDTRYYERVYALVAATRPLVDAALKIVEEQYEGDVARPRSKGQS